MRIVCLGASFTGRHLAAAFAGRHEVHFLSRNPVQLPQRGLQHLSQLDIEAEPVDAILDTVPARTQQDGALLDPPYFPEVERILELHPQATYVHVSSTSVYGGGADVQEESAIPDLDEREPPRPSARGILRLALEQRVLQLYPQARVLRSSGIYGPGRCLAISFRNGDFRRARAGNRMVSRIHVHDLCRLAMAIAARGQEAPRIINGVDRAPALNAEVFSYLEELLGIRVPGEWRSSPPQGRRIVSLHAEDLLGGEYRYPTYREGFPQCLER